MTEAPASPAGSRPIYLDYHATTPVDPRVAAVVLRYMTTEFGNASSAGHLPGERAEAAVEAARGSVRFLLGAGEESRVVFTSGATEALNLAIAGFVRHRRAGRLSSRVRIALPPSEHHAVLDPCLALEAEGEVELMWLEVDSRGRLDLSSVEAACAAGAELVCVMAANNEVGTIHPVETVARIASLTGALVVCDATQAAGKIPLAMADWGVAMVVLTAHKMYGPQGVGVLVTQPGVFLAPLMRGGTQQGGLRPGTLNLPGIAALGVACQLRAREMAHDEPRIGRLRDALQQLLCDAIPDILVNGDLERRLAGNLHVSALGVPNTAVQALLRTRVALSTSSACASGAMAPSHVLRALRLPEHAAEGALRFGLGKFTTEDEIVQAAQHVTHAVALAGSR